MGRTVLSISGGVGVLVLISIVPPAFAVEVQAGAFTFQQPSSIGPVTGRVLEQLHQGIQGGAKNLVERSGLADSQAAGALGTAFFKAFRTTDGKVTLAFMGQPAEGAADLSEMLVSGRERINWGIQNGQLRGGSNVARQTLGDVPCILQNIEHRNGARLRTWLCFAPAAPRTQMTMSVICEDHAACEKYRQDIDSVIATVRIGQQ